MAITQNQLAQAFGGLSVSLISSWENKEKPVRPPVKRLEAYATLFATQRSLRGDIVRLLALAELTHEERIYRNELLEELLQLREAFESAATDVWTFPEGEDVTIVCAGLPRELRNPLGYANLKRGEFAALHTYADPDALIELFGHIRARNPGNKVKFHTTENLTADDYTTHLVLLGGADWNIVTAAVIDHVDLPVKQIIRDNDNETGGFLVQRATGSETFRPRLDKEGHLMEDVAHFYRGISPFNQERSVTLFNGMSRRGTLGAVRALIDREFRDGNRDYLYKRFTAGGPYSIISRVPVVRGRGLTPDWTLEENRLHEWPETDA